jgi:transcription elongation factor GreA
MNALPTAELSVEEWRRTHDELLTLQDCRRGGDCQDTAAVEWRIANLESVLARSTPVAGEEFPGTVALGSRVAVHWVDDGREVYEIVDPAETAARDGRISYESPIGQALIGRRAGDAVEAITPSGAERLRVIWVENPRSSPNG